jgi:SAM-dependent methyltransferase
MSDAWWQAFFEAGAKAQIHDALAKDNAVESDWILRRLGVRPPASLLDVPCGEGRICRELAARGFRMTGVDFTPALLGSARERARNARLDINFVETDMRDLPWRETYDGAFCHFSSFGYFDEDGNRAFAQAVFDALRPGACFLVDTHTEETLLSVLSPRDWHWMGETLVLQTRKYNMRTRRVDSEWTYFENDRNWKVNSSVRLYSQPELRDLLRSAGFSECEGFHLEKQGAYSAETKRWSLVGRKE